MTLRNAFEGLSTESTLRKILQAVSFSRTNTDALRVNVENTNYSVSLNLANSGTAGTLPAWYAQAAVLSVDQREPLKAQMRANAIAVRNGRWTFS